MLDAPEALRGLNASPSQQFRRRCGQLTAVAFALLAALPAAAAIRPTIILDAAYADKSPKQKLDLYLPNQVNGLAPVVIWIHGGGFQVGDKNSMPYRYTGPAPVATSPLGPYQIQVPDVAALTAKGYAVVSLNYRLDNSPLSGVQDAKAAVRFLRANAAKYHLDPARFAAWGNSAGGYTAAMLGATGDQATAFDDASLGNAGVSSAVQAAVVWYGAAEFSDLSLSIAHYLPTAKTLPPFRVANGDADTSVTLAQALRLQSALLAAGAKSTLSIVLGAGHEDPLFMTTEMVPTIAFLDESLAQAKPPILPTFLADQTYGAKSVLEKLDLFLPAQENGPAPVVIWIHGDLFQKGNKASFPGSLTAGSIYPMQLPDLTALNAKGYAVVGINYRMGTSAATGALTAVQDGKAAVRWLRANAAAYNLDPSRIAVWGNSSGGYVAAMLGVTGDQATVFDDPELGNASVSSAVQGSVVWFGAYEGLDPNLTITSYLPTAKKFPPFRIVNGDADTLILPAQAQRLHNALVAAGAISSLTLLPGAGHEDPAFMATQTNPTLDFLEAAFATSTPVITTPPQGHMIATGAAVVFGAEAAGGGLSFQWKKNGVDLPGATSNQLLLTNVQAGDAGSYSLVATNDAGSATSAAATLAVVTSGDPGRLINASVRIVSGTDANVLIVGYVLGGAGTSGSKTLLIRGIGPTLADFGVPAVMLDPLLQIIPGGGVTPLVSNDNWGGDATVTSVANAVGAFGLTNPASKDAALVTSLAGGIYSAKIPGTNATTGTVLGEIYDAAPGAFNPATPRLINLSARAAMTNDNPLIAGFVIGGTTARTLLIRAIGPYLTPFLGPAAMPDPKLELYVKQSGTDHLLLTNDNWGGSALITTTGNAAGAFPLPDATSKDAVLLATLDPGVYSAKVLGVNNASGITLVEIYEIP